jgi:integrase
MPIYFLKPRKIWFIKVKVNGKYYVCYKPIGHEDTFKKRSDAAAYEPTFVASLMAPSSTDHIMCEDLVDPFFASMKMQIKPSTLYGWVHLFDKYWRPLFKGVDVAKLNNLQLDRFNEIVNKKASSISHPIALGKRWVKYLKRLNPILDENRLFCAKHYVVKQHVYHIYTLDEFETFLSGIDDDRQRFLFELLFFYGLRIAEALALKWSDFDNEGLHITRIVVIKNLEKKPLFTTPKTKNSIRTYPILDVFKPYLKRMRDHGATTGYCFPGRLGSTVMGQTSVRRLAIVYARKNHLQELKLHEFRHSCVSYLLMSGLNYRVVARWVGDTEAMILSTYSHLLPSEKTQVSDFLNKK